MIYRIIDKETKLFKRDDVKWDGEIEEAISTPCPQGFSQPRWVKEAKEIINEEGVVEYVGKWVENNETRIQHSPR